MVDPSQLKLLAALTMATSLSTANVGGGISTTEILATTIGEVFFTMAADPDDDLTQISKAHYLNENATDALTGAQIWLPNTLATVSGNYPITAQSDSEDDDSSKKIRVLGYDASVDPLQGEFPMDGLDEAFGSVDFSQEHGIELRSSTTGLLVAAAGKITLRKNGTVLGYIPAGKSSANSEVSIGLADALNDTDTADDAATPPAGVTFSRPGSYEAGLAVVGDDLPPEESQGIWFRWIQKKRRKPSADMLGLVGIRGSSS